MLPSQDELSGAMIVFLQAVDMHNHIWTNYVQAAYKGVFEYLRSHEPAKMPKKLVGLNLVIEGQVPQGNATAISSPSCIRSGNDMT